MVTLEEKIKGNNSRFPLTSSTLLSVVRFTIITLSVPEVVFNHRISSCVCLGPRLPGQGCNQLTQEIVSAICLDDRCVYMSTYHTIVYRHCSVLQMSILLERDSNSFLTALCLHVQNYRTEDHNSCCWVCHWT